MMKMENFKEAVHACVSGNMSTFTRLLSEEAALVLLTDDLDRTLLHWAAEEGRVRMVEILLELQARPSAKDAEGETPLHLAAIHGRSGVTKRPLERRAHVNARNRRGQTPVFLLTDRFPSEAEVFADVDDGDVSNEDTGDVRKPKAGWKPLRWILKALGADPSEPLGNRGDRDSEEGQTPLDMATTEQGRAFLRSMG